ncbi:MFS transporter [Helicobacter sp. 12S02232-10]|uniref:MFS transporter n=1 Tax=Helicobacter sp. 12S02232-10 TaxID=1476197 RepID=UPI000BA68D09|nr:MFS transporter [Helicobacter sp. 12S02232-10]PAF49524.1 MFS transporter [Helicobacter sp. 12S02232-10]
MFGWNRKQFFTASACFGAWTLDAFDFFILVFVLSYVAKDFNVEISLVSYALVLTLVFRSLGAYLFGKYAESHGRKPVLMINILVFSIIEILSGFTPNLTIFFVLRALYGIAMGGVWGVSSSLAMESVPDKARGFISGVFQAGYPFGYLIAGVVYGYFFEYLGWRGMFFVGAIPILLIPYIYFLVEESPVWRANKNQNKKFDFLGSIKTHYKLVIYLVVLMVVFNFLSHGSQDLYPTFLKEEKHFDTKTIGNIAIAYNIAAILGGIFFGSLSEKIGRKKAILIACFLVIPATYLWAYGDTVISLTIGACIMQIMVQGAWGVIPTYLNENVPSHTRSTLPGLVYQLGNLIASVNAPIQTKTAESMGNNYAVVMSVIMVVVAIAIIILIPFGKETKGTDLH